MSEQPAEQRLGFATGSWIAGYRLEQQIGRGGMSVVYRARDARLDRLVALKILDPSLSSDVAFRERFIRESRAAAAVDDPHIIPVYEAGEASGVLFIAMRLVTGGDLRSLLRRFAPLPFGRTAEIVSQVASALDAAHARGLVHRDVKPGNVLLAATESGDQPDHVYLADFGLSKRQVEVTGLTATGQFIGTLNYISPEQIAGRPVDGRADQYALACTAFEMLTGDPPFVRDEVMAVMYAQLSEQPPRPTAVMPGLPGAVDTVFGRALSKEPEERYASCREFAAALRDALGLRSYPSGDGTLQPQPWQEPAVADLYAPRDAGGLEAATALAGAGVAGAGAPPTQRRPQQTGPPSVPTEPGEPPSLPGGRDSRSNADLRRSRLRRLAVVAACVVVLGGAGGAAAYLVTRHHSANQHQAGQQPGGKHVGGNGGHTTQTRAVSLPPPGCTQAVGTAAAANVTPAATLTVPTSSYEAIVTPELNYTFVSMYGTVEVLRNKGGVPMNPPVTTISVPDQAHVEAITSNGKYLVVSTNHGVTVISISAAEHGKPAVVGNLVDSVHSGAGGDDMVLSPDDHFAFVAMRYANAIAVFDLHKALRSGFGPGDLVGSIPAKFNPHGMAVSADGQWLYVTTRFSPHSPVEGNLSVYSLAKAERNPAHALVSSAVAGCSATRVLQSADGSELWVLATRSNELVGFSATKLRNDPKHAINAEVAVGPSPLDEVLVNGGTRLLVSDNGGGNVAVVDPMRALAGSKHALVRYIGTSPLPRFFGFEQGGGPVVLLVTGTAANQIDAFRISALP